MYENKFNPWFRVSSFLASLGVTDRFLFAPLYGLGDRAAFYAYLEALQKFTGKDVAVVALSGEEDPVAALFPFLAGRTIVVPKNLVVTPLEATHWVYGTPRPVLGQLFFTWHWAANDGARALEFEENCSVVPTFTHKNLVKEILGLPNDALPSTLRPDVVSPPEISHSSRRIMLCPSSNTIAAPEASWWVDLALRLRALEFEPVFNVSMAASVHAAQQRTASGGSYNTFANFDGSLHSFLREVAGYRGVITARSGICELLALAASVPYVVLSKHPVIGFWRLGDGFGVAPEATLHLQGEDPGEIMLTIESIAVRWLS